MLLSRKVMNGYYYEGDPKDIAQLAYAYIRRGIPFEVKNIRGEVVLNCKHKDGYLIYKKKGASK